MTKEILQITLSKQKAPKTKLGKWFYWKIYFKVWKIWKPRLMSKFYHGLYVFFMWLTPKETRKKIEKELEEELGEVEVHIIDEYNDTE